MRSRRFHFIPGTLLLCVIAIFFPVGAYSETDCIVRLSRLGVEDGFIVLYYVEGGSSAIGPAASIDKDDAMSLTTAALIAGKRLQIRYEGDNVDCSGEQRRYDVTGIYIFN